MSDADGAALASLRIETVTPATAERLVAAVRRFHGETGHAVDARQANAIRALCGDRNLGLAWLLTDGAADCGYSLAYRRHSIDHGGAVAIIDDLWIEPARRGRGLGGHLLGAVCDALAEAGFAAVLLEADPENARTAAFYARAGFTPTGTASLEKPLSRP